MFVKISKAFSISILFYSKMFLENAIIVWEQCNFALCKIYENELFQQAEKSYEEKKKFIIFTRPTKEINYILASKEMRIFI